MFEWLASAAASTVFKLFGDTIVQPLLNVYLKSKDVDLEKFKSANLATEQLAFAVLDANMRFAQAKSQYALAVLQWWPFRLILFLVMAFCAIRFCLIVFDSTWWWLFGCTIDGRHLIGDACSWSIPPIRGAYGDAEMQFLLFFVIAKPVDTAISGALGLVSRYLDRGNR